MDNNLTDGSVVAEKMLPQSQVNELIGAAKAAAADKAVRETEEKYRAQMQGDAPKSSALDKDALFSEWDKRSAEREEAKRQEEENARASAEEAAAQATFKEVVDQYRTKLKASTEIAPDFDELMKKFPHHKHDALVIGLNQLPNTAAVANTLYRKPGKAFTLNKMAYENWDGFMEELHAISKRIDENATSKNSGVRPPLSKLKSDVVGLNNSGIRSRAELKKDKSLLL